MAKTNIRGRPRGRRNLTIEDVILDMRITAQACPHGVLTCELYNKLGRYSAPTVVYRFGSWQAALKIALPEQWKQRHPPAEAMIADVLRIAEKFRAAREKNPDLKVYTRDYYDRHGRWGRRYIVDHLAKEHLKVKGWANVKSALGITDM